MTDPFSIAAGTAGLISLGIEATQSLVKFYSSYKHLDADIDRTLRSLESLQVILDTLQKSTDARKYNSEERDLVATIESHVETCEEPIKELENEYRKFRKQSLSKDKIKAAIKSAARRATYPVRQSTLHKLCEDIDEIKSNLALALGTLGIADNSKIGNDLADVKTTLDLVKSHHVSRDLESWLKAPDATIDHNNACTKRHQGTGIWLVKDPRFKQWLADANSFMWLNGFAGSGKSVLCSTAIQSVVHHRGTDRRVGVAFFYFKFNEESKKDDSSMLRALLLQLSDQLQDGHKDLLQLQQTCRNGTPPPQALIASLRLLIEKFQEVYIMLDALDESPRDDARRDVLDKLDAIRKWNLQSLHLFVTSRNEPDIHESFRNISDEHVAMRNEGIDRDIANFVSDFLIQRQDMQKWKKYHDKIQEGLAVRAEGGFRWVECQLKSLQTCPCSQYHLDRLLRSLPKSLDETYERMLCNIPSDLVGDARRILTLLCFATKPLTVRELIDAVAVEINEPVGLHKDRRVQDYNDLHKMCPGFMELNAHVDKRNGSSREYVQIAHFSVQEYLVSARIRDHKAEEFHLDSAAANAEIVQVCLVYLLERDMSTFLCDKCTIDGDKENLDKGHLTLDSLLEHYPLAKFAAESWPQECKHMTEYSSEVQRVVSKLLLQNGTTINWLILHDQKHYGDPVLRRVGDLLKKAATPVYYASLLGFHQILQQWFDAWRMENQDDKVNVPDSMPKLLETINAEGGTYKYPLIAASAFGRLEVMQMLLDHGADVNVCGKRGTALCVASYYGEEQAVRLLLDRGADVNLGGERFENALQAASSSDSKTIVQMLLDIGADVNARGGIYGSALQAASFQGCKDIVEILLANGADVNAQGGSYSNALQAASFGGSKDTVEVLLANGADVNAQGGFYGNALQAASSIGAKDIVEVLLKKGADINAQGGEYGNALEAASYRGAKNIVEVLLKKGADVNAQGGKYGNALQAVSYQGAKDIVEVLLKKGADINAQGGEYGNALQAASLGSCKDTIELLIENGADINAQGGKYGNALQAASSIGAKDIVEVLLKKGADFNAQGGIYGNALQAAACSFGRCAGIVQILLQNGADVNAQGGMYGNALRAAQESPPGYMNRKDREEVIQLLLVHGAVEQESNQGTEIGSASDSE